MYHNRAHPTGTPRPGLPGLPRESRLAAWHKHLQGVRRAPRTPANVRPAPWRPADVITQAESARPRPLNTAFPGWLREGEVWGVAREAWVLRPSRPAAERKVGKRAGM